MKKPAAGAIAAIQRTTVFSARPNTSIAGWCRSSARVPKEEEEDRRADRPEESVADQPGLVHCLRG